MAYQSYADVLVAVDDVPGARAILQRAAEAGINEHLLAPTQAGVAITDGEY